MAKIRPIRHVQTLYMVLNGFQSDYSHLTVLLVGASQMNRTHQIISTK
jgi:hypothetical protein